MTGQGNRRSRGDGTPEAERKKSDTNREAEPRSECHRRGCSRQPAFRVTERYLEETGKGPVEATARLCREHTDDESPTNLDDAYEDYVFHVEPL